MECALKAQDLGERTKPRDSRVSIAAARASRLGSIGSYHYGNIACALSERHSTLPCDVGDMVDVGGINWADATVEERDAALQPLFWYISTSYSPW